MKYFLTLAVVALCFVSCSKKTLGTSKTETKQERLDKMAVEFCDCSNDMLDLLDRVDKYSKENNIEELGKMMVEIEQVEQDMDSCLEKLEKKYPELSKANNDKETMNAIKRNCPRMAKALQEMEK